MQAHLQRIIDSEDAKAVLKEFKAIIRRAYGKKVGERFVKNDEIWAEFEGSEAYSELIFNLLTDPVELANFIKSILPGNLEQEAARLMAKAEEIKTNGQMELSGDQEQEFEAAITATQTEPSMRSETETRILTHAEIIEMDSDDLKSGLATGRYKLS
jgi:hypothetical protein